MAPSDCYQSWVSISISEAFNKGRKEVGVSEQKKEAEAYLAMQRSKERSRGTKLNNKRMRRKMLGV